MANKICIPDAAACQPPTFPSLQGGQMFRFADSYDTNNVYMKVSTVSMVLLKNGVLYTNTDTAWKDRALAVLPKVTIEAE